MSPDKRMAASTEARIGAGLHELSPKCRTETPPRWSIPDQAFQKDSAEKETTNNLIQSRQDVRTFWEYRFCTSVAAIDRGRGHPLPFRIKLRAIWLGWSKSLSW